MVIDTWFAAVILGCWHAGSGALAGEKRRLDRPSPARTERAVIFTLHLGPHFGLPNCAAKTCALGDQRLAVRHQILTACRTAWSTTTELRHSSAAPPCCQPSFLSPSVENHISSGCGWLPALKSWNPWKRLIPPTVAHEPPCDTRARCGSWSTYTFLIPRSNFTVG